MDVYAKIVGSYAMMGQDENNEHECGDGGNGYNGDDDYGISSSSSPVIVIDLDDLANNPRGTMMELCYSLNIDYRDDMLKWTPGSHECDGPWGEW